MLTFPRLEHSVLLRDMYIHGSTLVETIRGRLVNVCSEAVHVKTLVSSVTSHNVQTVVPKSKDFERGVLFYIKTNPSPRFVLMFSQAFFLSLLLLVTNNNYIYHA